MSSLVNTLDTSSLLYSNCYITTEQQDRLIKSTSNQLLDDILKRSRISKGDQEEIERTILKDAVNTKVLQQALSIFIITNDLSLRIIESPSLHALLKAANPVLDKEVISSHAAMSSHILSLFLSYKDTVMKMLQSTISKIHLSLGSFSKRLKRISLRMMMNCLVRMSQGSKF